MNWSVKKIQPVAKETAEKSDFTLPDWNHRVLIVEDEASIADAYRDILSSHAKNVTPLRRSSRSARPAEASHLQATQTSQAALPESPSRLLPAFELTVVHSAEKAIAAVKHAVQTGQPYTMGFFDVLLGGDMDGVELVKKIHEFDPNLYAVFVTAYSDRSVDSIQAFLGEEHASRWDYLNKPFTQGEILQKARGGVTLWNLRREKIMRDEHIASIQKRLLESERHASMAAVARGINHEFRNILMQILAKAEIGLRQGDAQMRESLNQIKAASLHAGEILKRFNMLANGQKIADEQKPLYLHQPIEEALLLMEHELRVSGVKVCWIRKKQALVEGHATSLMQVFVNLLINAVHAMGNSGQIDLSIAIVGDMAEVRFRDYGPGMSSEVLERATEPFFTTKGEKGTGLGLSISRKIIENDHRGSFVIANHEYKGLEVVITIPLYDEKSRAEEIDAAPESAEESGRT